MKIVLFDIDGTLINTRGSGVAALKMALAEAFGVTPPEQVQTSGRTDRGIVREFFVAHGIEDSEANWRRFCDSYHVHLEQQLPLRDGRVLPGVVELLYWLSRRSDIAVGLLTGNTRRGAWLKLEHFRIRQYFAFGAYGEDHAERNSVASDAFQSALAHVARDVAADRVFVIGDTPLDVRCARHIGAKAIAVATGLCPIEELAAESPDLLLGDLSEVAELLWMIDGLSMIDPQIDPQDAPGPTQP